MQDQPTYQELEQRLIVAAEALRQSEAQATAGRLALELMHEVKNPLETLGHLVYLTRHASRDFEQLEEYMALAEEQMRTVSEIASQTLSFAQVLKSPKLSDLMHIAEAALRIHQRTIDAKKVRVLRDFHLGAVVPVHKGEILQVVSNLIVNALDALPRRIRHASAQRVRSGAQFQNLRKPRAHLPARRRVALQPSILVAHAGQFALNNRELHTA